MKSDIVGNLAIIVLAILVVIFGPLLTIWSWNVLFGAHVLIPYSFETWAAVVILAGAVRTQKRK